MYDSHIHLSSDEFGTEQDTILSEFASVGGRGVLNVGYDPETSFASVELSGRRKDIPTPVVKSSVGLHPMLIGAGSPYEKPIKSLTTATHMFNMIKELLSRQKDHIVAIGETGLDYYHLSNMVDIGFEEKEEIKQLQKQLFRDHLNLALENDLPLTIHTRDVEGSTECMTDALALCTEVGMGNLHGSFHSYTGPDQFTDDILGLGFVIGVNAICTYRSGENVREMLRSIPIEKILLETDAPYLPLRTKNRSNMASPTDLVEIVQRVAEIMGVTPEAVVDVTNGTYESTFTN